jgi:hypothetical protein
MANFGKLNFSTSFNPTSAFPLDARSYFDGDNALEDAKAAASVAEDVGSTNTVYHYGQKLLVNQNGVYTWYVITTDKTLKTEASNGASGQSDLPEVSEEDNGKVLMVIDGEWAAGDLPLYDGAYELTPSANNSQTLYTAQKLLDADIKVNKIPYTEVSNSSNGLTVTIGSEV